MHSPRCSEVPPCCRSLLANGLVGVLSGTEHTLCPRNSWHLGLFFPGMGFHFFFFFTSIVSGIFR